MKMKILAASVIAASITLTGCANKQQTGALIGAGVGGFACNMLTKKSPTAIRLTATAGCGMIGGLIGNHIGRNLDARDQMALMAATQKAMSTNSAGTHTWKSAHSGATASLVVSTPERKIEPTKVTRAMTIEPVMNIQKLDAPYLTLKNANVRSAPNTNGAKVAQLPAMTEFRATGKVGDWILVSRKGVVVGYVYNELVQSKSVYERKLAEAQAKAAPKVTVAQAEAVKVELPKIEITPALKLDEATPESKPELAALVSDVASVTTTVSAETTCRTMNSVVTDANGKVEKKTSNACKSVEEDMWAGL